MSKIRPSKGAPYARIMGVGGYRPIRIVPNEREASIERIQQVLGWQPEVELTEGLASVIDHLKQTGELG